MAKSKLVKINEKIAGGVTGGYKKIEEGAVGGFTKMTDKFVDSFLTKDGESVEDAKQRLAEKRPLEGKAVKAIKQQKNTKDLKGKQYFNIYVVPWYNERIGRNKGNHGGMRHVQDFSRGG